MHAIIIHLTAKDHYQLQLSHN